MNRLLAALGMLTGVVCLVGCPDQPRSDVAPREQMQSAAAVAADVVHAQGYASTISCDLLVRVKPPDGDSHIFTMTLWCPADGRIRLRVSKLDLDFIDALVQSDGSFVLELVRSHEVVHANLSDISVLNAKGEAIGPPFLSYLRVLVAEAKHGPLPERGPYRDRANATNSPANTRTLVMRDPTTALQTAVVIKPDGTVGSTSYLDAAGHETLRIDYNRYEHFDELYRPTRLNLVVAGDACAYGVVMRKIDAVPMINEDRMHFVPDSDDREITLAAFLDRLRE